MGEFETVSRFMERYPGVRVVLTHGLSWRSFAAESGIHVPDAVSRRPAHRQLPDFHVQLLFAIFLGGMYDYPMTQIRTALERVVERLGPGRLMWGTDIPMVMRFQTYRQSLDSTAPQPRFRSTRRTSTWSAEGTRRVSWASHSEYTAPRARRSAAAGAVNDDE